MNDLGFWLQLCAIILLILWRLYWHVTERTSEQSKPKTAMKYRLLDKRNINKLLTLSVFLPISFQLLGVTILPFPVESPAQQIVGIVVMILGWMVSVRGRYDLGTNWARNYDYQVKKKQELVTSGIYAYIRHPIYIGIALMFIGAELIVQSYLLIAYILVLIPASMQAKWEEKLLVKHFGDAYTKYMKRSKMFLPYLW